MTRSGLLVAALVGLATLVAADTALRLAGALRATPHSFDVPRNPHFRRGWDAYTRPRERAPDERLVVVISNSQGFLRENADGTLAYPARLESQLNGDGRREVIVANWSLPGAQAPEMIVLAARAAQHRPDLVLLVAGAANFSPQWTTYPLSFWLSDATLLAYDPAVRSRLPAAFLERTGADDPLGWIAARTGTGRARRLFVEPRDETWTWRDAPPRRGRGSLLGADGEAFVLGLRRRAPLRSEAAPIDPARADSTALLLSEFDASLRETSPGTRLLVLGMPHARPERPGALWQTAATFAPLAEETLGARPGVEVLDALEVVPSERFVHETHLEPEGHAILARWLVPHVRRLLDPS